MLTLISPAKTLDFENSAPSQTCSEGVFLDEASYLIGKLKKLSQKQIGKLMNLSDNLSALNRDRYQQWHIPFNLENAKQALWAFKGDVYLGLDAENFSERDIEVSQNQLRIISGLYGLLKPLDLIQPYRLEMGTRMKVTGKITNLYQFWGEKLTTSLNEELKQNNYDAVINLASNEYYKALDAKRIDKTVITPVFKDAKGGDYRVVMVYAKQTRGKMANFIIKNELNNVNDLKAFDVDGYHFNQSLSSEFDWVYTRG